MNAYINYIAQNFNNVSGIPPQIIKTLSHKWNLEKKEKEEKKDDIMRLS